MNNFGPPGTGPPGMGPPGMGMVATENFAVPDRMVGLSKCSIGIQWDDTHFGLPCEMDFFQPQVCESHLSLITRVGFGKWWENPILHGKRYKMPFLTCCILHGAFNIAQCWRSWKTCNITMWDELSRNCSQHGGESEVCEKIWSRVRSDKICIHFGATCPWELPILGCTHEYYYYSYYLKHMLRCNVQTFLVSFSYELDYRAVFEENFTKPLLFWKSPHELEFIQIVMCYDFLICDGERGLHLQLSSNPLLIKVLLASGSREMIWTPAEEWII